MEHQHLDYNALENTPVAAQPYPHVVVPHFVGNDALKKIITDFPRITSGGSFAPESLQLKPSLRALVAALQGPELRAQISRKFNLDLSGAKTMLTMRGFTREKDGRIHCDSVAKRVTALLYLNTAQAAWSAHEGCLRLLHNPHDIDDYAVEITPAYGTLVVFPNGPTAWHGHLPFVGQRNTIQLNYMATNKKARYELRRHQISAFVKRFPFIR